MILVEPVYSRVNLLPHPIQYHNTIHNLSSFLSPRTLQSLSLSTTALRRNSLIYPFSMLPIFQMHLEIIYCRNRTRRIQFARTIMASDTGKIHPLDIRWDGLTSWRSWARGFCCCIDRGVTHRAFKLIVGVMRMQFREPRRKPCWRCRL